MTWLKLKDFKFWRKKTIIVCNIFCSKHFTVQRLIQFTRFLFCHWTDWTDFNFKPTCKNMFSFKNNEKTLNQNIHHSKSRTFTDSMEYSSKRKKNLLLKYNSFLGVCVNFNHPNSYCTNGSRQNYWKTVDDPHLIFWSGSGRSSDWGSYEFSGIFRWNVWRPFQLAAVHILRNLDISNCDRSWSGALDAYERNFPIQVSRSNSPGFVESRRGCGNRKISMNTPLRGITHS